MNSKELIERIDEAFVEKLDLTNDITALHHITYRQELLSACKTEITQLKAQLESFKMVGDYTNVTRANDGSTKHSASLSIEAQTASMNQHDTSEESQIGSGEAPIYRPDKGWVRWRKFPENLPYDSHHVFVIYRNLNKNYFDKAFYHGGNFIYEKNEALLPVTHWCYESDLIDSIPQAFLATKTEGGE